MSSTDHKFIALITGLCTLFMGIVAQLIYLQIIMSDQLSIRSAKNYTRTATISSIRGSITDCNGNYLATNRPVTQLYWQGTGNKRLTPAQIDKARAVHATLSTPETEETIIHAIARAERTGRKELLGQDIPLIQLSQITEQFPADPNIVVTSTTQRLYPQGCLASHIIGYLGSPDTQPAGRMGLEKIFEQSLKGMHGTTIATINAIGRPLSSMLISRAQQGNTLQTTLDIPLQRLVEEQFPAECAGAVIIMDPHNGALRVVHSRPHFNPTLFLKPLSHERWQELQDRQPFLNRAFMACYPPGSILKLVTVSAAIDQGLISPDSQWNCTGSLQFIKRTYHCARRTGHGPVSTKEALALSCNIPFFDIAQRLNIDTLADYAQRFGLGQKTGIIFQEQTGLIPTSTWKYKTKGQEWWPGETLSATIGQSYMLVSPIQVARMISGIIQGYLVRPRILEDETIDTQPLLISEEIREFLKDSMKNVVSIGTGKNLNTINDMIVYAKTSTSQTSSLRKRHLGGKHKEHTWFASCFQYKNDPPLTLIIIIEHTGSNRAVVTLAKKLLIGYKKLRDSIH